MASGAHVVGEGAKGVGAAGGVGNVGARHSVGDLRPRA